MNPFESDLRARLHGDHDKGRRKQQREHGKDDANRNLRITVVETQPALSFVRLGVFIPPDSVAPVPGSAAAWASRAPELAESCASRMPLR